MAKCKICGGPVLVGPVMHADCLERQVTEAVEKFCDSYCAWPGVCSSQEQLHREHCDNCPMDRLMKLARK